MLAVQMVSRGWSRRLAVVALAGAWLLGAAASAQEAGDELVLVAGDSLSRMALPRGPQRAGSITLGAPVEALTYLADGRLVGVTKEPESQGAMTLVEVVADGSVIPIGTIAPDDGLAMDEDPLDLAIDGSGRLFLLTSVFVYWNPPESAIRIVELDPDDGSTITTHRLESYAFFPTTLVTAPDGLWALGYRASGMLEARWMDGSRAYIADRVVPLPVANVLDAAGDASGAIWVLSDCGVCSPPLTYLSRFDPQTGALDPAAPGLGEGTIARGALVDRGCVETPTRRCLQGGRFAVEVDWRDPLGRSGAAAVATGRSADTGLFWFFDAANWELMVKVLDGCAVGGHFWVFTSALTNVEYALRVTDLETGVEREYVNPLGQLAESVADTRAFACD